MHTQIQQAEIDFGALAAESVSGALRDLPSRYGDALGLLWHMQDDLGIANADFAPIATGLMLMCLLDPDPMSLSELTVPLTERARGLSGRAAAHLIQESLLTAITKVVGRAVATAQRANDDFLATLDKAVPEEIRELPRDAFEEFAGAASRLQHQFLQDPMLLLDPRRYLREQEDLVSPFVYLTSAGPTTMQVSHEHWKDALTDPLTYVREYLADGRTVFELACVPGPRFPNTMSESAWKNFADRVAGALVIAEGADREHPVEGMWIRKTEERWPVDFTPFGHAEPASTAPMGALV